MLLVSPRKNKIPLISVLLLVPLLLSSCAPLAPSGEYVSDSDISACDEFLYLQNPYDGSNESLWDSDAMDSYQRDVEYAAEYAEETDLVHYFTVLDAALDDVISGQTDGSSKSEVESWMGDVEAADWDLTAHCDLILGQ